MQAKVSRSRPTESQEVVGRVMDVVNTTREEALRIETDRLTSLSTHPVETVPHSSPLVSSLASVGRKITTALAHATQSETVLVEIAALLGEAYGVQACIISNPGEPYSKSLTAWFAKTHLSASQQGEILANYGMIQAATLERSSLFVSDLNLSEINSISKALPIRGVLSLPTQFQGHINGVISLLTAQAHRWSDLEIETLTQVVDHIAIALTQLTLQRKVAKQSQSQALLREVSIAIQNSVDVPQIQVMVLEGLARTLEIDRAFVLRTKFWDPRDRKSVV